MFVVSKIDLIIWWNRQNHLSLWVWYMIKSHQHPQILYISMHIKSKWYKTTNIHRYITLIYISNHTYQCRLKTRLLDSCYIRYVFLYDTLSIPPPIKVLIWVSLCFDSVWYRVLPRIITSFCFFAVLQPTDVDLAAGTVFFKPDGALGVIDIAEVKVEISLPSSQCVTVHRIFLMACCEPGMQICRQGLYPVMVPFYPFRGLKSLWCPLFRIWEINHRGTETGYSPGKTDWDPCAKIAYIKLHSP